MLVKHLWACALICLLCNCNNYKKIDTSGQRIEINDSIATDTKIDAFIAPYRTSVNKAMDSVLSYAPETYSKKNGKLNTAIGNLMADATFKQANPIFKMRQNKTIDFVLLNYGGIRSIISKGPVTTRTAYEVMPFENAIVVVALQGQQVIKMIEYLSRSKQAHPVSKHLELVLNADYSIHKTLINGKKLDPGKTYYVATNDYLFNGGDNMQFFKTNTGVFNLDYKIRNLLIDYFKTTDTLRPTIDNRFVRLNP